MSTTINNSNITDMLIIGELVLAAIGQPAHHTTMYAKAAELGFPIDKIENLNPRIWADWRKMGDGTGKFRFYGKSVFGLNTDKFPAEDGYDPTPVIPARKKAEPKPMTRDEKIARIAAIKAELATLEAEVKAEK